MKDSRVSVKPKVFSVIVVDLPTNHEDLWDAIPFTIKFKNEQAFLDGLSELFPIDHDYDDERHRVLQSLKERDNYLLDCGPDRRIWFCKSSVSWSDAGYVDQKAFKAFLSHGRKYRPTVGLSLRDTSREMTARGSLT